MQIKGGAPPAAGEAEPRQKAQLPVDFDPHSGEGRVGRDGLPSSHRSQEGVAAPTVAPHPAAAQLETPSFPAMVIPAPQAAPGPRNPLTPISLEALFPCLTGQKLFHGESGRSEPTSLAAGAQACPHGGVQ